MLSLLKGPKWLWSMGLLFSENHINVTYKRELGTRPQKQEMATELGKSLHLPGSQFSYSTIQETGLA